MLDRLRGRQKSQAQARRPNPFLLPTFAPGVKPASLANDSAERLKNRQTWANDDASLAVQAFGGTQAYGLAWANGYGFMGYAYLAQLSQVAEYRQLVQTTAEEMTREWIEIKAVSGTKKADKVRKLTQILNDDLGMRENCKAYAEQDGYFGVGHLYLDTGDTDNQEELKRSIGNGRDAISRNKAVKLKAVRTVEPQWCYPNGYDTTNPLREDWYRPQQWFVNGLETHATRLLTGHLRPVPDILKPAYAFGGLALTQMAKAYVENWLRTRQSVADIVWRYTVNVLLTDLQTLLQSAGDSENILARVQALNALANNNGALVLNKDTEDFKNISAPLAGLHELQAQAQEHQAAPGRIPFVKLFGFTPAGLNASSDGEIRTFYDTVHGCQTTLFNPVIRSVLDFAQLAEYGEVDPEIAFVYRPLWQLDAERKSALQKTRADTHAIYLTEGVISAEEVREALSHDDESPYAGLDLDQPGQAGSDIENESEDDPAVRLAHHVLDLASGDRDEEAEDLARLVLSGGYRQSPAERLARNIHAIAALTHDAALPSGTHWVTLKNGEHALVDGDGNVVAGAGGALSGAGGGTRTAPNQVGEHHKAALRAYTAAGYREINGHLRGGKAISETAREHLKQLDDVLGNASTPEARTVYRGLGSLAVRQLLGPALTAKKGQIITDAGFPSTSAVENIARQFVQINPGKNILMSIKMPAGSRALDVSQYSDNSSERETLIARNARYKVVKFDPKRRLLEVELMPHEKAKTGSTATDAATDSRRTEEEDKFGYATAEGLTIAPSDDPDAEEFYLG